MPTARPWHRRCLHSATSAIGFAVLSCTTATAVDAQTLTLPTVRTFGPGPEEYALHRLVRELRIDYAKDNVPGGDSATAQRAQGALRRVTLMVLASVTKEMLGELAHATTKVAALNALAGQNNLPDDVAPSVRLEAATAIVRDPLACSLMSQANGARVFAEFTTSPVGPDSGTLYLARISQLSGQRDCAGLARASAIVMRLHRSPGAGASESVWAIDRG